MWICAATVVIGTAGSFLLSRQRKSTKDRDYEKDIISHELFGMDALFYKFDIPPITTVTWFKGNHHDAKLVLENRMKIMIHGCVGGYQRVVYSMESALYPTTSKKFHLRVKMMILIR